MRPVGWTLLPHLGHNMSCGPTFSPRRAEGDRFKTRNVEWSWCRRRMTRRASREADIALTVRPFEGRDGSTEDVVEERATVGVARRRGRQDVGVWRGRSRLLDG